MKKIFFLILLSIVLMTSCEEIHDRDVASEEERIIYNALTAEVGKTEFTIIKTIKSKELTGLFSRDTKKALYKYTAEVTVSIDMDDFSSDDIEIFESEDKSVTIKLPKPELSEVNITPHDIIMVYEEDPINHVDLTLEEMSKICKKGEKDIRKHHKEMDVILYAEEMIVNNFKAMLIQMGYNEIIIQFQS